MSIKISSRYKTNSDIKLLKLCYQIADTLKDNPLFPEPVPSYTVLQTACDEFRLAYSLSSRRDAARLSAKNDKRAALIAILDQLAAYVTELCKGDKTMLLSSGFQIVGVKVESTDLQPITSIQVVSEMAGQVTIRAPRVKGARSYIFQYTADPLTPQSIWISETSLTRAHTLGSLQSLTRYWFRVMAIGKGNQAVYSPPVARVVN